MKKKNVFGAVTAAASLSLFWALLVPMAAQADTAASVPDSTPNPPAGATANPAAIPATAATPAPTAEPAPAAEPASAAEPAPSAKPAPPPTGDQNALPSASAASNPLVAAADPMGKITVNVGAGGGGSTVSSVTLSDGHYYDVSNGSVAPQQLPSTLAWYTPSVMTLQGGYSESAPLWAGFAYQINMPTAPTAASTPTGFWIGVIATVYADGGAFATCALYRGDPTAGENIPADKPFTCHATTDNGNPANGQATVVVGPNSQAEAGGTITTTGGVGLTDAYWEISTPYAMPGASSIEANGATAFDSIYRETDKLPVHPYMAKSTFIYQITSDGLKQNYWVLGWASNDRQIRFQHDSKCYVFGQDPRPYLDDAGSMKPLTVSPFTCTWHGYDRPDRGHWINEFVVSPANVRVLPDDGQNRVLRNELVKAHCSSGNLSNCGLVLAKVTRSQSEPVKGRKTYTNTSADGILRDTTTISNTFTTTNTFGVKVSVAAEFLSVFKASVETSYTIAITNTELVSETKSFEVPPLKVAWFESSTEMATATGDLFIRDRGVVYKVVNVGASFPIANGSHDVSFHVDDYVAGGSKKSFLSGSVRTNNGVDSSTALSLIDGDYALPLTDIASPFRDVSAAGGSTVAPNSSTTWSTVETVVGPAVTSGAETEGSFNYEIAENGVPMGYWVAGMADTWGPDQAPGASCLVYQGDPEDGGISLGADAPYQCLTTISPADAGGTVHATYTVSPRLADLTPGGPSTTPPEQVVPAGSSPVMTRADVLADTGSSVDAAPYLAGLLALLLGAGLIVIRRRRRSTGDIETDPEGSR